MHSGRTQRAARKGFSVDERDEAFAHCAGKSKATKRRMALAQARAGGKKMTANGVERGLRGERADAVTVAGEAEGTLARAAFVGDGRCGRDRRVFPACRRRARRCR